MRTHLGKTVTGSSRGRSTARTIKAKPFIGFASGDEPEVSPNEAIVQGAQEAIRRHLRPELVNRLTKIVHFKPLTVATVREVLQKLLAAFNERLVDRGVTVELDESAKELMLREGFSAEYGARNLERVMDRLLGTLIAEALLSGKITAGQTVRLDAKDGQIQFR